MSSDTPTELVSNYDTTSPIVDGQLLENLRLFENKLGHIPTAQEMRSQGPHAPSTYHKRFGSWNQALVAAGFELPESRKGHEGSNYSYSKFEVVRALRSWANKNGSPPTKREFEQQGPFSTAPAKRHFESWNKALNAAGLEPRALSIEERQGEDNPMWSGGGPKYYGPSWEVQREKCLERDEYGCLRCGMSGEDHREKYSQGLHVHHIKRFRSFKKTRGRK